jgi:hypothetical protein
MKSSSVIHKFCNEFILYKTTLVWIGVFAPFLLARMGATVFAPYTAETAFPEQQDRSAGMKPGRPLIYRFDEYNMSGNSEISEVLHQPAFLYRLSGVIIRVVSILMFFLGEDIFTVESGRSYLKGPESQGNPEITKISR